MPSSCRFVPRSVRTLLLALPVAATLAACGGGDDGNDHTAYLADGHVYPLSLDVDGGRAVFSPAQPKLLMSPGIGAATTLTLTGTRPVLRFGEQAGAGATARLVVLDGLVVGNAPLQGRVTPFVAVNSATRSLADAAGEYNVFGVTTPAPGDYLSAPATWRIDAGGQLQVCAAARPIRVAACPAGSLTTYTVSVDGDDFVASAPAVATPLRFRIATADGERILLHAGGGRFAIGLPDGSTGFRAARSQGPSTDGAWSVVDHTAINFSSEGVAAAGGASNFSGVLSSGPADTPAGVRQFDGGTAYVMQNRRLTVLLGRPATQGDGFLQIAVTP